MADKIYHYIGPIKRFGKIVAKEWEGETTAPSLAKGINNLKFKAKKYLGLAGNAQVELIRENIDEIDVLDYEEEKEYNRSYDPDYDIPDEWEGSYEDGNLKLKDAEYTDYDDGESPFNSFKELTKYASEYGLNTEIIYPDKITMKCCQWIISGDKEALLDFVAKYYNEDQLEYITDASFKDSKVKDSYEDGTYDVCWEDITTHKRGCFRNRTESQVERLERNKNLRIISISPSEDENKQYTIDFYYNIYYVDIDNTYEEEKKALKEEYLPRYNLKLIEFAEIHDGGPDNCRITLKGTKSDLEKFIYDMDENPEDYKFKARDKDYRTIEIDYGTIDLNRKPRTVDITEIVDNLIKNTPRKAKEDILDYTDRLSRLLEPELNRRRIAHNLDWNACWDIIEKALDKLNIKDTKFNDVEPRKGESKEDFISRFMSATKEEYPDRKQRLAVAYSYWKNSKKK